MKTKAGKINIVTLGCAKNTVDSEALYSQLLTNDFTLTDDIGDADIAIINTCGFIDAAKRQSVDTILSAVQRKTDGNLDKVFVMGCLSERYSSDLKKEIPEVDRFFGTNQLPDILEELGGKFKYELLGERALSTPHHYAYVKISEGCDNPCSFCAIPIMRGGHKTKPVEQVMDETMRLVEKGVKELIVIGQDTTYYGLDLYGKRALSSLLTSLASVNELKWIRLMYAYPAKFPLDILDVIASHPKICRYLDMPVQHAADNVLKSMRRGITRKTTEQLIGKIRSLVPEELAQFVKETKFDRLGVFTYSQEDDTAAYDLEDPIPADEKERRKEYIMEVQRSVSLEQNERRIGTSTTAVIERIEDGYIVGRTEWDAPEIDNEIFIASPSTPCDVGDFVEVTITDATEYDLYGSMK